MPAARALALLLLLPGCFLFDEPSKEGAPAECAFDVDCDDANGAWCDGGRCVLPAGCDEELPIDPHLLRDACRRSLDCVLDPAERARAESDRTIFSDDGSLSIEPGDLCVLARRTPRSCRSLTRCTTPLEDGLPGGFACERDEACASGLCLTLDAADDDDRAELGGPGLCAQLCVSDGDCAGLEDIEFGARVGLECRAIRVGHRFVQACVPSRANPSLTICGVDADCRPPDACRFLRIAAESEHDGSYWRNQLPSCGPPTGGDGVAGQLCSEEGDAGCESGVCAWGATTDAAMNAMDLAWTDTGADRPDELLRCSAPCRRPTDCGSPLLCRRAISWDAVGEPILIETPGGTIVRGLAVPRCLLPVNGCVDQVHCLGFEERRDVDPSCCTFGYRHPTDPNLPRCDCTASTSVEAQGLRCRVYDNQGRLDRSCALPGPDDGAPGACCEQSADCSTNLCVEARADRPHPEGCAKFCSTPCDDVPGQDRCAWFAPGGTYADGLTPYPGAPGFANAAWLGGARCERTSWDGAGSAELPVCR